MKTKADTDSEFRADLQALLDKYGAELCYEERGLRGGDIHIVVDVPSIWVDHELVREWTEIDLGGRVLPTPITTAT